MLNIGQSLVGFAPAFKFFSGAVAYGRAQYVYTEPPPTPPLPGMVLWLRADDLVLNDGDAVSAWTDASAAGNSAAQSNGSYRPIYKTGFKNGKPVVRFDGSDDHMTFGGINVNGLTGSLFMVYNHGGSTAYASILGSSFDGNYGNYHGHENSSIVSATYGRPAVQNGNTAINGTGVAITTVARPLQLSILRSVSTGTLYGSITHLAADNFSPHSRCMSGNIAEVLLYTTILSVSDRNQVERYLSLKYDIPIPGNAGILSDYQAAVLSNGGGLDRESLMAASGFLSGLYISTFSLKVAHAMPLLGQTINSAMVPILNRVNSTLPTNSNFVNGDFTLTGGLKGNGSNKRLMLNVFPASLTTNCGFGYWQNQTVSADPNIPYASYSNDGNAVAGFFLYTDSQTFLVRDDGGVGPGISASISAAAENAHYYGQRSGSVVAISKTGVLQTTGAGSWGSVTTFANSIGLMGNTNFYSPNRCAFAYLVSGSMTPAEISGMHELIEYTVVGPLGRAPTTWEKNITAATGYLDTGSRAIGLDVMRTLQMKSYKNKIRYLLPVLGTGLNESCTPIINRVNGLRPLVHNFTNSDITATGGLQGDGTTKFLDSQVKASELGTSSNGGVGFIEMNWTTNDGRGAVGTSNNSASSFFGVSPGYVGGGAPYMAWGDPANSAQGANQGNVHVYAQRSSATSRELYVSGVLVATSTVNDGAAGISDQSLRIMGDYFQGIGHRPWPGKCGAAYMTDGTMTTSEIADWHNVLMTKLINPKKALV